MLIALFLDYCKIRRHEFARVASFDKLDHRKILKFSLNSTNRKWMPDIMDF
jgi:hypothetical protein